MHQCTYTCKLITIFVLPFVGVNSTMLSGKINCCRHEEPLFVNVGIGEGSICPQNPSAYTQTPSCLTTNNRRKQKLPLKIKNLQQKAL